MLMQTFIIELLNETERKCSLSQRMSVMKRKIASARGVEEINLTMALRIQTYRISGKRAYRNVSMNIVHEGGIKAYNEKSSKWSTFSCVVGQYWRKGITHDADEAKIWTQSRLRFLKFLQRAKARRLIWAIRKSHRTGNEDWKYHIPSI